MKNLVLFFHLAFVFSLNTAFAQQQVGDGIEGSLGGGVAIRDGIGEPQGIARIMIHLDSAQFEGYECANETCLDAPVITVDIAFSGITGNGLSNLQVEFRSFGIRFLNEDHGGPEELVAGLGLGLPPHAMLTISEPSRVSTQATLTMIGGFFRAGFGDPQSVRLQVRAALDLISLSLGRYIVNNVTQNIEMYGWGPALTANVSLALAGFYRIVLDQSLRATVLGQGYNTAVTDSSGSAGGILYQVELRNEFYLFPFLALYLSGQSVMQHHIIEGPGDPATGSRSTAYESSGIDFRATGGVEFRF